MKYHEIGESPKNLFKVIYGMVRDEGLECSIVCYFAFRFAEKFGEKTTLDIIQAADQAKNNNNTPTPISVRLGIYKALKQLNENMNNW